MAEPLSLEARLRRLQFSFALLVGLLALAVLGLIAFRSMESALDEVSEKPTAEWDQEEIRVFFYDAYQHPVIVTHLVYRADRVLVSAPVSIPLHEESRSYTVDPRSLRWSHEDGSPARAPSANDEIIVAFIRGEWGTRRFPQP